MQLYYDFYFCRSSQNSSKAFARRSYARSFRVAAIKAKNLTKISSPVSKDVVKVVRDSQFLPGRSLAETLGADLATLEKEHESAKVSTAAKIVKKLSIGRLSVPKIKMSPTNRHRIIRVAGAEESKTNDDRSLDNEDDSSIVTHSEAKVDV